jgi:hypothetical protein
MLFCSKTPLIAAMPAKYRCNLRQTWSMRLQSHENTAVGEKSGRHG